MLDGLGPNVILDEIILDWYDIIVPPADILLRFESKSLTALVFETRSLGELSFGTKSNYSNSFCTSTTNFIIKTRKNI